MELMKFHLNWRKQSTKYILQEIGNMGRKTRMGEGHEITITADDFRTFWKRVSEWITSSPSSMHYDHYKAAVKCELVSKINAQQVTVIARSGLSPVRWRMSLQVLLEKLAGICLVKKTKIHSTL